VDEDGIIVPGPDDYIDATFGANGYLARTKRDYLVRPGQVAFARAVDAAIVGKGHLLAEAGCGTGKSFSYSVPASYHAARTGNPVVIVTANNALSEQLASKDLPFIQSVVPWEFSFALLKGRNNFLCTDKYLGLEADLATNKTLYNEDLADRLGAKNVDERRQLPILYNWAKESYKGFSHTDEDDEFVETGDKSDLPFEPLESIWHRFSVTANDCKRSRCAHKRTCFSNRAAAKARQSLVVVTNYHMLFAHLRLYMDKGKDLILPPFHVLIADEAHKMPEIARDFFGFKITPGSIKRIERRIRQRAPNVASTLTRTGLLFFSLMRTLKQDKERYKARLKLHFNKEELDAWEQFKKALKNAHHELLNMGEEETTYAERTEEIVKSLEDAMEKQEGDRVFFLEEDSFQNISICSKLVYASEILRPHLFGKVVAPPHEDEDECSDEIEPGVPAVEPTPVSVVAASATLATDNNDFSYVADEMGAKVYETLVAESPFNWQKQCLFIVPTTMPEPQSLEFRDEVAKHVERIIKLARGRTLALFTSNRVLNYTHDSLITPCRQQGITLFKQGDMPRTQLIEAFKEDVSSVLLGTESFWAGVDIPGEALSVVVIDRLPFPTPDDPVLDMISERDEKWFFHHSLPHAVIAFKQGFGRLIRSMECKGVVVCLDRRLVDKRYGKQFLRAIPNDIQKSTNLDAIVDWLRPPALPQWDEL